MNNFDPKYSTLPNPIPEQDAERDAESMKERERILGLSETTEVAVKAEEPKKETFFTKFKTEEPEEN